MFKLEQRNELLTGATAGAIAGAAKYAVNELMQLLNIAKYDNNATALGTVMKSWDQTLIFSIFGFIIALIIGAFFGVIIAFAFRYLFTKDNYLLKGAMMGIGIWLLNFGIMSRVFNYPVDMASSLGDIVSMLLSLIIYGGVCAYTLASFGFFQET